jgi:glucokinase
MRPGKARTFRLTGAIVQRGGVQTVACRAWNGHPAGLLSRMETPFAIGIDFGGTTVKIGVAQGGQLVKRAVPLQTLEYVGPEPLLAAILAAVEALRVEFPGVCAVGAGLPGIIDSRNGIVHELTHVPGWREMPLVDRLRAHCRLPARIENDANAMAYAEWKFGAARGKTNVVCVTLGTGVGGGLILDGQLYRGSALGAGEIGNMSIDYRGVPAPYGNFGALEEYVGNRQIAARAQASYAAAGQTRSMEECTPLLLAEAALAGDAIAAALWEETGLMIGAALSDIIWLLNPDAIVLGGGVANAGDLVFAPMRRTIRERTSPVFWERLEILPAALGHDAGLIGAAALAVETGGGV